MTIEDMEERHADKRRNRHDKWVERQERSKLTRSELTELKEKIDELRTEQDREDRPAVEENAFHHFNQLPISQRTQMGLERGGYKKMTPIQCESIPLALTGHDILGAAKTGSGKTLCFVLPILERLHLEKWDSDSGVGAIVLSPTRELALQIFKVLQVVGYKHQFSAALLTGGRDVEEEKKRIHLISIIVGTPGRVYHHLRDGTSVSTDNVQLLVLDEADRLLDMGFRETLTGIMEFMPPSRQTLLFSATQTTDVKMLAEMSLKNPRYVASHMLQSAASTPSRLCQNFLVTELDRKLDILLMFLKRHPNDKIVVFVSTCNQVKYMYLAFSKILKKMRIPSMCLTSKMKQFRREEVFLTFCRCKSAVLFCTDVASRGLDFPMVHWVIQYDCPDSAQTYIHRAGRTARAGARGVSLLMLTPSETPMLSFLHAKKVPLREIQVKPHLLNCSKEIFVAMVVQGLKYEAQKAFIAYLRSIHFAANKHVFKMESIDVQKFAHSLGLLVVPNLSELTTLQRGAKNLPWDVVNFIAQRGGALKAAAAADQQQLSRKERHLQASDMFRQMQQKQKFNAAEEDALDSNGGNDDEMDFLVKQPKRPLTGTTSSSAAQPNLEELTFEERMAGLSKAKKRKLIESADIRVKDLGLSKRTVFAAVEDDGKPSAEDDAQRLDMSVGADEDDEGDEGADYSEVLRRRLRDANADDTLRMKQLRRQRQLKREGRLDSSKVGTGAHAGDNSQSDSEGEGNGDDYDSSSGDDDDLNELIRAAKGELYDDEGADEDGGEEGNEEEEDEEAPVKKQPRHEKR